MSEAKENNSNQNLAVVIFSGLTVLLVAVFLSSRGEDVGRLPQLLGSIFNGDLFSFGGFSNSLLGLLIAFLIVAAWFGLGKFFTLLFEKEEILNALNFARNCAFGAAVWSLIWFFIGLLNGYNRLTAIAALIIGLVLAIYFALKDWSVWKSETIEKTSTTVFGRIAFGLIIFTLLLTLVSALAPPTAKDALLYHIALPKEFVAQGNNQIVEGNIASFLALGAEMQNVWAMLLGDFFNSRVGEAAVGATVFMFVPLLLLMIYGWAREFEIEKNRAILAALIVAAIPTVYHDASSIYADLPLALFITLAIRELGKWWTNLQTKQLVYAALALGAALSIKLTTVFVIAALALIVLLRARQAQNAEESENENAGLIFAKGFSAFVIAALVASPWYLRTWILTGSPIFPFYMNLWKGTATGWDTERSALFQAVNANYGGAAKGIFDYLLAPVKISLFAQPEIPQFYDGVLDVSFLLGLVLIVWAWRKIEFPVALKIAVGVSGIVFLFWLFSSEQMRYLLPVMPSLAVATIFSASSISQKSAALQKAVFAGFLVTSLVGILTSAAWFAEQNPLHVIFGGETRDNYLSRRLDYYEYYTIINHDLPANAKIWLVNLRRDSYYLDRAYFSDYLFEDWTLRKMIWDSRDVNDLRAKIKQTGINYILIRHDFLFDYAQSTIVDDKKSKPENLAKLNVLRELVLDNADVIKSDKKFSLVKLPEK